MKVTLTALQEFASAFHQDFFVQFSDIQLGGEELLSQLGQTKRTVLRAELAAFLAMHESNPDGILRRAWLKLGAQVWLRRGKTRPVLRGFLNQLS